MADPVLHIKDCYYFEVPKVMWQHNYESADEVPSWLREAHPEATAAEFNRDLAGKILIPQPFGTPKNLYESASGFCISKFMILEVVVAILLIVIFRRVAQSMQQDPAPRGKFRNLFEAMLLFVRDQIVRPAIGRGFEEFVPLLWTLFFFILGLNLMGLIPCLGTATGAFGTTITLASVTLATGLWCGSKKLGIVGYWTNMAPPLPAIYLPLTAFVFVIEVAGMLIKHTVLGVRLLANMVAGHLVLLSLLGIIVSAAGSGFYSWLAVVVIGVCGSTLFSVLELGVAALQAYVFTFLSALFIGAAIHHHH